MRARRVDENQKEIVARFKSYPGVTVVDLSAAGEGMSDLLIGYRGANYLIEVKDGRKKPSAQKLTKAQQILHNRWTGQIDIVNSTESVDAFMEALHKKDS